MDSRIDLSQTWIFNCLYRLVVTGIRYRSGIIERSKHDRGVFIRRPLPGFRDYGWCNSTNGTKSSHPNERSLYKECVLAVQYGMGAESLALRIGKPTAYAQILLAKHKATFAKFWKWSDAVVNYASIYSQLEASLGWRMKIVDPSQERSIRNFPMQANGSEMLRVALILCSDAGISVCAPVHDAILIEAPTEQIEEAVKTAQAMMAEASKIILGGFELRSDANIINFPERYMDERGIEMWNRVDKILNSIRQSKNENTRGAE